MIILGGKLRDARHFNFFWWIVVWIAQLVGYVVFLQTPHSVLVSYAAEAFLLVLFLMLVLLMLFQCHICCYCCECSAADLVGIWSCCCCLLMLFIFSVIVVVDVLVIVVILIAIIPDGSSVAVSVVAAPLAVPCGRSSASAKGWTHAHAYTHAHTHAHVHAHAHHHNGHHHGHNTITHLVLDRQSEVFFAIFPQHIFQPSSIVQTPKLLFQRHAIIWRTSSTGSLFRNISKPYFINLQQLSKVNL